MYQTVVLKNNYGMIKKCLNQIVNELNEEGNMFLIVNNDYSNNKINNDIFDYMQLGTNAGLQYVNTIVAPVDNNCLNNISYIIWFAKNRDKMYFNKDKIREKHIWKDVEWGKREKNYNPLGKDPGNVWIPTEDDGKGKITKHILMSTDEIYNRIFDSTIKDNDDKIFLLSENINDKKYKYNNNIIIFEYSMKENGENIYNCIECPDSIDNISHNAKVIFNTSESMDVIKNNSVDLVVTSPPYWDLKDYFKENQIGQESYEVYSERMYKVWLECYKKLNETGSLWININVRVRNNTPIYLPKLFIEQCKDIGFSFKDILIWHKSSGIPTNAKNIVDRFEYVLIFTKTEKSKINIEKFNDYHDYKNEKINQGLIWNINRKAGSVGKKTIHPAIYPTELINRIINVASNENDTVLDPFLGSGTTLISALNNKRNCIGFEYFEGFKDLMQERFNKEIVSSNIKIEYL